MVPEIISVGCKVEIRVLQQARREENEVVKSKFFVTKVADVDHKKDIIVVTVPIVAGLPKLLEQNLRYDFIFVTEYGLYRAEGQCIGRKKEGEILLNVLALTSKTAKFQRREYYRESCSIPVDFVEISNEVANLGTITEIQKATKNDDTLPDYGTILDISGGGIRYSTPYKVRTDVYNLYLFQIGSEDDKQDIMVIGYVIASEPVKDRTDLYHNRVQFVFKNEKEREKIVQFVFEEQRRKRQNNL